MFNEKINVDEIDETTAGVMTGLIILGVLEGIEPAAALPRDLLRKGLSHMLNTQPLGVGTMVAAAEALITFLDALDAAEALAPSAAEIEAQAPGFLAPGFGA